MADTADAIPLASHTRRFLWATIGVVAPLAILLVLFPRHTTVHWMWVMRDPRSAILVGAVYVGAAVYYWLAVQSDDWLETQAGLEGIFTVSAVLLLAVIVHWDVVRPWHLMTLIWMPAYYVPLLFVPYLFRLEGGWARPGGGDRLEIPRAAAAWLTARGFCYAALAAGGFVFADALSGAWPWAIDPVEVRMFLGQPATFILSGLAVLRGNRLWRRHKLALLYLGSLGVVQLAALLVLPTPYRWASPLGVLLPAMFAEWIVTPLVVFGQRQRDQDHRSGVAGGPDPSIVPAKPEAAQHGVMILGATYLAIGVIGFLPIEPINPSSGGVTYLLRHIAVNGLHSVVHLVIGITGLAAARRLEHTRVWGNATGVVLLVLFLAGIAQAALIGFPRDQSLLGLVALNSAGHVFHLATGVVALVFAARGRAAVVMTS
jgi:hypothetical protein